MRTLTESESLREKERSAQRKVKPRRRVCSNFRNDSLNSTWSSRSTWYIWAIIHIYTRMQTATSMSHSNLSSLIIEKYYCITLHLNSVQTHKIVNSYRGGSGVHLRLRYHHHPLF